MARNCMKTEEKEERKKKRREREREEEKGRESPVTPDEDKTGAWRDGPKAQWGCRDASFLTLLLVLLLLPPRSTYYYC